MSTKAILAISNSNYIKVSAGTEKSMREISKLLKKNKLCYLQIFPVNAKVKNYIGINLKDQFLGIYNYRDFVGIIKKYDIDLIRVHVHHLLGHNKKEIIKLLLQLQLPITYFAHDYYAICSSFNLINSNDKFCGTNMPSPNKCKSCSFYNKALINKKQFNFFFKQLDSLIYNIIAPSKFVAGVLESVYPNLKSKIVVRNHLINSDCYKLLNNKNNPKIRIAYCGNQTAMKGYKEWKELIKLNNNNLEFYYFGSNINKETNVKNVSVNIATDGQYAMTQALVKNKIDVVFFWSHCQETYSYVFYEAYTAGCIIISNFETGNVTSEIINLNNGLLYKNFDELINCINNNIFENQLRSIYKKRIYYPTSMLPNPETKTLLSTFGSFDSSKIKGKCRKKILLTKLYLLVKK